MSSLSPEEVDIALRRVIKQFRPHTLESEVHILMLIAYSAMDLGAEQLKQRIEERMTGTAGGTAH